MDYSRLPERHGPVVTSHAAVPLQGAVRLAATAHMALGLAILSAALWMYISYHRTGLVPPGPEPSLENSRDDLVTSEQTSNCSAWTIYGTAALGLYFMVVSVAGLSGLELERRRRLFLHILLLSCLIVLEAAFLLLMFTENPWKSNIPEDCPGYWSLVKKYVDSHSRGIKVIGLLVIAVQIVLAAIASWLHSIYVGAYDEWLDRVQEQRERVAETFERTVEQSYAGSGPGAATWGTRMRAKYGLGSADWEATTAAGRRTAALTDDGPV